MFIVVEYCFFICNLFSHHRITGETPFKNSDAKEVLKANKKNQIMFSQPEWNEVSTQCIVL